MNSLLFFLLFDPMLLRSFPIAFTQQSEVRSGELKVELLPAMRYYLEQG
ncbi:hypothetical protein Desaci_4663 [Desulfosporosinus acidiphilus SJ4]|uniref:Uncharacterized protein n=1 Tax=Desulfosporosinus acidiphilus (strain DSM 22704 / JCM 16185 / SJ4) TaxID=646529 RepID=I4DCH4_DESAJ|nr:hypothetical protein [Desulfosporosinus acidiphilus]AFM43498.1 hypothetical protein Desaci_4663 [Desulfosporosinus acidiphilus SJ4]